MEDSVFTKIINGEIPCHKVHEDDKTIVFMDIHPVMEGHMLVVPKKQVDHFEDLPDEDYEAVFRVVKKAAKQAVDVLGSLRAVVLVMGYDVPHAHVHILPSNSGNDFYTAIGRIKEAATAEPNHTRLAEQAEKLRF